MECCDERTPPLPSRRRAAHAAKQPSVVAHADEWRLQLRVRHDRHSGHPPETKVRAGQPKAVVDHWDKRALVVMVVEVVVAVEAVVGAFRSRFGSVFGGVILRRRALWRPGREREGWGGGVGKRREGRDRFRGLWLNRPLDWTTCASKVVEPAPKVVRPHEYLSSSTDSIGFHGFPLMFIVFHCCSLMFVNVHQFSRMWKDFHRCWLILGRPERLGESRGGKREAEGRPGRQPCTAVWPREGLGKSENATIPRDAQQKKVFEEPSKKKKHGPLRTVGRKTCFSKHKNTLHTPAGVRAGLHAGSAG